MSRQKLQNLRSSEYGKVPTSGDIEYGEIVINYNAGNEKIFIRNSNDEIVDMTSSPSTDTNFIKNYSTVEEYNTDTTRELPNVCYIEETDEIIYNK